MSERRRGWFWRIMPTVGVCAVLTVVICGASGLLSAEDKNGEVDAARAELAKIGPPQRAFVTISKVIRPSVVNIVTVQNARGRGPRFPWPRDWPFEGFSKRQPENKSRGLGSGVIVDATGHILTNSHVVADAETITVYLEDETEYEAKLVGTDPKTDLAVIKIDAKNLVVARLGDSEKLEVGEWVLAFGAPFGLTHSVSAGIVSAKGRSGMGVISHAFRYENFIQTDAAINRGNSGGPLVNMKAEVIGINAAIVTRTGGYQGVGFAIPSNLCKKVLTDLIKYKKVIRGFLGVQIDEVSAKHVEELKLPDREGAYVENVYPDTPADEAGLKRGDVIIGFDGKKTGRVNELRSMVAAYPIGKTVKLKVLRDGKELVFDVSIAEQPDTKVELVGASWEDKKLGMTIQTLLPALARRLEIEGELGLYTKEEGVLVVDVDPDGPAARHGIRRNDLIKEVANKAVTTLADYRRIRRGADVGKGVLLFVKTGRKAKVVLVK